MSVMYCIGLTSSSLESFDSCNLGLAGVEVGLQSYISNLLSISVSLLLWCIIKPLLLL